MYTNLRQFFEFDTRPKNLKNYSTATLRHTFRHPFTCCAKKQQCFQRQHSHDSHPLQWPFDGTGAGGERGPCWSESGTA